MRRVICLILLFFIAATLSFGQETYWYFNKPIVEIKFIGLESIQFNDLHGITDPFIGKVFSNELYLDLQTKILALRYFDQFTANAVPGDDDYSSVIIEFTVTEVPSINSVKVVGNKKVRTADILDVISMTEGILLSKTVARLDATEIENLYLLKGFPEVTVTWETVDLEDSNRTDLIFTINEGQRTRVKSVVFVGNDFASSSTLKGKLLTKTNTIINSGVFQESNLEIDKYYLTLYYNEKGFIDASVSDVTKKVISEEGSDKIDLEITYYIEEGNQYTYGGIEVVGNTIFDDEEIKNEMRLKEGKVLNRLKLEQDLIILKDMYYNDGYVANGFQLEEIRDEENLVISFKMTIVENARSHIENIIIKGNDKTNDHVLFRELPINVGDIFYKDKITDGLRNLNNLNYFDNIDVQTPTGSAEGLLDLVITVEEGKTTDINFGISFSGEQGAFPINGFFKWSDLNFKGNGQQLSIGTNISTSTQNVEFSFRENWLGGIRWFGGISAAIEHSLVKNVLQDRIAPFATTDNNIPDPFTGQYVNADTGALWDSFGVPTSEQIAADNLVTDYVYALSNGLTIDPQYLMEYDSVSLILEGSTGYTYHAPFARLGIGTGAKVKLNYLAYDSDLYRPFDKTVRDNHEKVKWENSIWLSLSMDDRDNFMYPSEGFVLKQIFNYTGGILMGSKDYIRSTTAGEVFFTIFDIPVAENWNYKNILAIHSSLSFILPQWAMADDFSWGWEGDNITNTDKLTIDGSSMSRGWAGISGLESVWDSWIEIRMPIFEDYLWADSFFSATAGWEDYKGIGSMRPQDFQFSFGVGLRSVISILPIGFYLVKRFDINEAGKVEWQTGEIGPGSANIDFVISFNQSL